MLGVKIADINQGGTLMLPYIIIRELGVLATALLSQIISEYNYAKKNGNCVDEVFLTSPKRMADYLGITKYTLIENLDLLAGYDLIAWFESEIADTIEIFVYPTDIIEFKQRLDEKHNYIAWDIGLKQAQNPSYKENNFAQSTLILKAYIEKNYTDKIPMIYYQRCNDYISEYESDGLNFCEIDNLEHTIKKNINYQCYGVSLLDIVEYLCKTNKQD